MKSILILLLTTLSTNILTAQDFEGAILYHCNTNFHIKKEINYSLENPSRKNYDSINVTINNSTLSSKMKEDGEITDSIKIVFGKNKFIKTYFKKGKIEYIFDFNLAKKITHTPEYECIDTTDINILDYKDKVKIFKSDSTFLVNGIQCKKIEVKKSNFYFTDIYYTKSEYRNLADGFIYELNNSILFQNLYFLKDLLEYKKIIKIKFYNGSNVIDSEYVLSSMIESNTTGKDFILPKYEYCFWDILEDKKLMKKHIKRKRKEQKGSQ